MELTGSRGPTNPGLLEAMRLMSLEDDQGSRARFYKELLNGTFLVPLADESQVRADGTLGSGQVNFVMARSEEGYLYMLVFTDMRAVRKWKPLAGRRTAIMPGPAMFKTAVENGIEGIVVNQRRHTGATVTRAEIEALAEGLMPTRDAGSAREMQKIAEKPSVVRPPSRWPSITVADQLKTDLRKFPDLAEAYLFEMTRGDGVPHLTIGLRFNRMLDELRVGTIVETIGAGMKQLLLEREYIDLLPLDDELLREVQAAVPPFYPA
jgi:hypothetical protein